MSEGVCCHHCCQYLGVGMECVRGVECDRGPTVYLIGQTKSRPYIERFKGNLGKNVRIVCTYIVRCNVEVSTQRLFSKLFFSSILSVCC